MIQSLPNTNLNLYKGLPVRAASFAGSTGSSGRTISSHHVEKLEVRFQKVEQSNQALLEELMRMQTEMRSAVQSNQQMLAEERRARQNLEHTLRSLQGKFADTDARTSRAEVTMAQTKASLAQLVNQTRNVERAILISQQGLTAQKDAGHQRLMQIQQNIDAFGTSREQLEKSTWNMRQQFQELATKVHNHAQEIKSIQGSLKAEMQKMGEQVNANLTKHNSQMENRITDLQKAIQDLRTKLNAEQNDRQQLQQKLKDKKTNEIENSTAKNNENVLQRIQKLETNDIKNSETKVHLLNNTVDEMDTKVANMMSEIEKVLAAEIQTRRDQGKLLGMKIYECNDNLRAGLSVVQDKKPKDVNWKLDAVKVHQISQEAAEDVRKELEKQIKDLQKQQRTMEEALNQLKRGTSLDKDHKPEDDVTIPKMTAWENTSNAGTKANPKIVGDQLDQQLDHITFAQEKLKRQVGEMQQEIKRLTQKQTGSFEDHFSGLDRRMTARLDAETRNRNKDVQALKDDIESLRKQNLARPEQNRSATSEDVKKLKQDMTQTKANFRKMAESIQVVKTTLGDRLTEEVRIRKDETGRLQIDMAQLKNWMQKSQ